mmetsp:Transcript_9052/g.16072  ORF Transcript_9052/g.16072 Transcript_9052/m.16072 type:complete len:271 (-) Transcript_9052:120-932(-)
MHMEKPQTPDPSNQHPADILSSAKRALGAFCVTHKIQPSHGEEHALKVLNHATNAIAAAGDTTSWGDDVPLAIQLAALLHDVDDHKYFPQQSIPYQNARDILSCANVKSDTAALVISMIELVSCSANGNFVPPLVADKLHLLIPRWSDRLEAVGAVGVVRCYQYNQEKQQPLSSASSPRAQTVEEVWKYATPDRFVAYQERGGTSTDMISHYYDKLLHIAMPPPSIVQNRYLESAAERGAAELLEVCVRYGKTGVVDEDYIRGLEARMGA